MKNSTIAALLVCANAAFAFAQGAAALPARIGIAAAVRGAVRAAAPGAIGRIVESGKPLFIDDHVTTGAKGRLQILLADETVFTIGPDADIVLDKFVYDPNTGAGTVAAQIVRGAFRFVTGRIARLQPASMKVRLNTGTIGIRGTVVVGETGPDGSIVINAGAGSSNDADEPPSAITVTNAGRTVDVFRTGEGVRFSRDGAPSNPVAMLADIDRLSGVLGTRPSGKQSSLRLLNGRASDKSGRSTSRGREYSDLDAAVDLLASNGDDSQVNVSQFDFGLPDGPSSWGDLARISGTGVYSGSGQWTCSSGVECLTPGSGSASFSMDVNFNSRSITGGSINIGAASGASPASGNFMATNLPASGAAVLTLSGANFSNTSFNNTTFTFYNTGGTSATEAVMSLKYNFVGTATGSGTVTGTR